MRVIILGSAAGGGVPQWNCGCPNCTDARHDNRSRTQSSVAVSADGERWILLNASPDLRMQLAAHHELWPRGRRGSGVGAVILTDGEIDHTLGLLLMRESPAKLPVYAPGGVAALLDAAWPLYRVLSAYTCVESRLLEEGRPIRLTDRTGAPLGICCAAGAIDEAVRRVASGADLLLFDGTFWSDGELRAVGGGDVPTAREMGHLPVGEPGGSLELLPRLGAKRTVLVHINNTNPVLCRSSAERQRVEAAGIVVGEDGMEFEL